ncbi:hypothetical protein EYF80_044387 [Liparis tanakae]|uniref:Uncharacterized protein n=1 Tax=Liparis tanakae TaxID=230148 RepID=A0A4Z2FWV9_9TELE|nr:hypothetical protein EYF80_044387 [Liparis tanakae]
MKGGQRFTSLRVSGSLLRGAFEVISFSTREKFTQQSGVMVVNEKWITNVNKLYPLRTKNAPQ